MRRNLTACDLRTSKSNGKSSSASPIKIKIDKKRKSRISGVKSNEHVLKYNKQSTCDTD